MAITPDPSKPPDSLNESKVAPPWWRRWLWFLGLWGISVLLVYLLSLVIRWAIVP